MPEALTSETDQQAFRFHRDARSGATMIVVALWLAALVALWALVEARVWIVALLALPVLPALWEVCTNPVSTLEFDAQSLRWTTPRSTAEIATAEIAHVELLTRWDFSIRATVHTRPGTHHRIPAAVTPKGDKFEAALIAGGIPVKRQHFTVL